MCYPRFLFSIASTELFRAPDVAPEVHAYIRRKMEELYEESRIGMREAGRGLDPIVRDGFDSDTEYLEAVYEAGYIQQDHIMAFALKFNDVELAEFALSSKTRENEHHRWIYNPTTEKSEPRYLLGLEDRLHYRFDEGMTVQQFLQYSLQEGFKGDNDFFARPSEDMLKFMEKNGVSKKEILSAKLKEGLAETSQAAKDNLAAGKRKTIAVKNRVRSSITKGAVKARSTIFGTGGNEVKKEDLRFVRVKGLMVDIMGKIQSSSEHSSTQGAGEDPVSQVLKAKGGWLLESQHKPIKDAIDYLLKEDQLYEGFLKSDGFAQELNEALQKRGDDFTKDDFLDAIDAATTKGYAQEATATVGKRLESVLGRTKSLLEKKSLLQEREDIHRLMKGVERVLNTHSSREGEPGKSQDIEALPEKIEELGSFLPEIQREALKSAILGSLEDVKEDQREVRRFIDTLAYEEFAQELQKKLQEKGDEFKVEDLSSALSTASRNYEKDSLAKRIDNKLEQWKEKSANWLDEVKRMTPLEIVHAIRSGIGSGISSGVSGLITALRNCCGACILKSRNNVPTPTTSTALSTHIEGQLAGVGTEKITRVRAEESDIVIEELTTVLSQRGATTLDL